MLLKLPDSLFSQLLKAEERNRPEDIFVRTKTIDGAAKDIIIDDKSLANRAALIHK